MSEERKNFAINSETSKESRKRGASSDQQIMHKPQHALKRPISEVDGIRDKVISNFCKQGVINLDSWINIQAKSGEIGLEKSNLNHNDSEFPSIVDLHPRNKESKKISNIEENTTSNIQIPQTDTDGNVAHIGEFKGIQKCTLPDTPTLPGLSSTRENISHSNLCAEKVTTISQSKLQTIEKKPAMLSNSIHKRIFSIFEMGEGRNMYKCWICKCSTENYDGFKKHLYDHSLKPFYCNACKGCFSDKNLHLHQRECDVCKGYFECKSQLEDHFISHENHHKKYCRLCQNEIANHTLKGKERKVYKCCEPSCAFESRDVSIFRIHLYIHTNLKLFKCNRCGRRYTQYKNLRTHLRTPESCDK